MSTPKGDINSMMSQCKKMMLDSGYSESTVITKDRVWRAGIVKYLLEHEIKSYTPIIGKEFLSSIQSKVSYDAYRHHRSGISTLNEYYENGSVVISHPHKEYPLKGELGKVADSFLSQMHILKRSLKTIEKHRYVLNKFIGYVEQHAKNGMTSLNESLILDYIDSQATYHIKKRDCNTLRLFFDYVYEQKLKDKNLRYVLSGSRFPQRERIPSTYSKSEIQMLEASIDKSSSRGKRDYVIFLLASKLGLRASDISLLEFSNIDWDKNLIKFRQYKTEKYIELPLLHDVGEALIIYLKHARPKSKEKVLFLTLRAPIEPMSSTGITHVINRIFGRSNVDYSKKKHGAHSLRHSLATNLLSKGASLPLISEVLGHTTCESTMEYIRADMSSLSECCLDVPAVSEDFYNQQGGVFYV